MKSPLVCALCCAAVFGCMGIFSFDESPAMGSTLNLSPEPPDLAALFLTTTYTPSSGSLGTFSVTGWPTSFGLSTTSVFDIDGNSSYNLTALINKNTGQLSSGSLTIEGTIPALGASSGTLLTGTISGFGYQPSGGDIFEVVLKPTGGDLESYYTGKIGIELTATGSGFTGSFLTDFATGDSQSVSDNFNYVTVPEPASVFLVVAVLACGLPIWRHRRRHLNCRS